MVAARELERLFLCVLDDEEAGHPQVDLLRGLAVRVGMVPIGAGALDDREAIGARRAREGVALIVPLALSSLLYGMGYLVLSVAAEMRYHLWTILASLVAATIAGSDLISGARPERLQAGLAASLIAIVTMLALVARFSL